MTTTIERTWVDICPVDSIPERGCRVVYTPQGQIAIFRTASGEIFALDNRCPHKGGPLSEGIVHDRKVTCPLHNWVISLESGEATGADKGGTRRYPVRLQDGRVHVDTRATSS